MCKKTHESIQGVRREILSLFSELSGYPCTYLEYKNGKFLDIYHESKERINSEVCKFIKSKPELAAACEIDERLRAQKANKNSGVPEPCHAGLWNVSAEIKVDGKLRGVLLFGQTRLACPDKDLESKRRLDAIISDNNFKKQDKDKLKELFENSEANTKEKFDEVFEKIISLEKLLIKLEEHINEIENRQVGVFHELSNWLQPMIVNSTHLEKGYSHYSEARLREQITRVRRSTNKLSSIVQTLGSGKLMSTFRFKRLPIKSVKRLSNDFSDDRYLSLESIFNSAVKVFSDEARFREIEFDFNFKDPLNDSDVVFISVPHIYYALNNLVHNAVKYSYRSTRSSEQRFVKVWGEYPAGPSVGSYIYKVSIENYGVGIYYDEVNKIFDDEYQGRQTVREFRSGAGKGLTLAKRILNAHGAHISVESNPLSINDSNSPWKTRFTVYFPRENPEEG